MINKNKYNLNSPFLSDVLLNDTPTPRYLYKHRYFDRDGYHIDALKKKSIWLSKANKYDDPTESTLEYRFGKKDFRYFYKNNFNQMFLYLLTENNIKTDITEDELEEFKNSCFTSLGRFKENKFVNYVESQGVEKQKIKDMLNKMNEIKKSILQRSEIEVSKQMNKSFESVNNALAEVYISCSFTECNNNQQMWAQYSNNHEGFLIEYDTRKLNSDELKSISKIRYGEKPKINIFDLIMLKIYDENNTIPKTFITDFVGNLLTKNKDWEGQKEWRLIPYGKEEGLLHFPYISSIYLGNKISDENKNKILDIAKKENYKVYVLVKDSITGKMIYEQLLTT